MNRRSLAVFCRRRTVVGLLSVVCARGLFLTSGFSNNNMTTSIYKGPRTAILPGIISGRSVVWEYSLTELVCDVPVLHVQSVLQDPDGTHGARTRLSNFDQF